jgi:Ca-activated chloride channel family protein
MAAKIYVERMMHRNSIMVAGESAASYALIKLIPSGDQGKPLGLNLALALDVSGSMHDYDGTDKKRIERVQRAAQAAIAKLKPEDRLAIVAFAKEARVLLPSTPARDQAAIGTVIKDIENADVDPGGTAMDQGIALALGEVDRNAGNGRLYQMQILTD